MSPDVDGGSTFFEGLYRMRVPMLQVGDIARSAVVGMGQQGRCRLTFLLGSTGTQTIERR
jgi:hypothetical protein